MDDLERLRQGWGKVQQAEKAWRNASTELSKAKAKAAPLRIKAGPLWHEALAAKELSLREWQVLCDEILA